MALSPQELVIRWHSTALKERSATQSHFIGLSRLGGTVPPPQLIGIELIPYAHELPQETVWIGPIQWLHENGFRVSSGHIPKPLHNILNRVTICTIHQTFPHHKGCYLGARHCYSS